MANQEHFVKIENELITEGHEFHLTDKELYLFSVLYADKRIDETVRTNIAIIADCSKVRFAERDARNNKAIKDTLYSLKEKSIINFCLSNGEIPDDIRASDTLIVTFNPIKSKGFTKVPFEKLESIVNLTDYYIYVAVKRWDGAGVFRCSFERWARILSVKSSTAQKWISEAIKKEVIYCDSGDRINGEIKQEQNLYKVTPFLKGEKSNMTKKKESEQANEAFHKDKEYSTNYDDDDLKNAIYIFSNFTDDNGNNIFPNEDDYVLLMEVEDNTEDREPTELEAKLLKKANWRIKLLQGNEWSKKKYEDIWANALYIHETNLGLIS